ncbi:hypothetical protein LOTGIDRAFT_157550 [Lottia gigantea]|uniref:G-protein coupled receptors family 1 profile domain-containing protein n=1 Tax=Lottia gigantea TaxID=225164 RepID=V4AVL3_LOTGI|nr:hypothetical protein LOTGIDRAFT_157550 [Lottia gigantea]ESP01373.1 hypothetical protein LOTGIDRAFT_157550 [Lottia gigantea]
MDPFGTENQTLVNKTFEKIPFQLSDTDVLPRSLSSDIRLAFMVCFIAIITLAFLGNAIVIFVIGLARSKLTVTDMYILSLAVADLLISILNMPFQLNFYITNKWTMGEFLCKFSNYIQGVTVTASILTLTTIAIDRYLVICRTVLSRRVHTKLVAGIAIASLWILSLLIVCPQLFGERVDMVIELNYSTHTPIGIAQLCREHFDRPEVITIVVYVFVYLLPVVTMMLSYGAIGMRLWFQHPIGDMLENPRNHSRNMQQKKKIIQMLMLLVLAFTVLWLPFFTVQLIEQFQDTGETFRTPKAILQLVGYSNCCVNPIIYAFLNRTFQREFKNKFLKRSSVHTVHIIQLNRRTGQSSQSDKRQDGDAYPTCDM